MTAPAAAVTTEPALSAWLAAHVAGSAPPYRMTQLMGGNSNLTYVLTDASEQRLVLRRPPHNSVLATAHDMEREWRVLTALQGSAVPVPPTLAFCPDAGVTGAPFHVTRFVDGYVHHTLAETLTRTTPEQRAHTSATIVDVLADLHTVDIDDAGLAEHGPRGGYVERQLRRWSRQYAASADPTSDDAAAAARAHDRLTRLLPAETETTVVHGDYRLQNCITSETGGIGAVLDWEISTLGDPLADLAYWATAWVRPGAPAADLADAASAPTLADGFTSVEALLVRYRTRSGRDIGDIRYYLAFNHWRAACITQGVVARAREGAIGATDEDEIGALAASIGPRVALAHALLDELG